MMNSVLRCLFWLAIAAGSHGRPLQAQDRPADPYVDVVILAGQSNMVGGGHIADLPPNLVDLASPIRGFLYRSWLNGSLQGDDWVDLGPRNGTFIGPEMMFGQVLAEHRDPQSLAIIKMAYNGTSLNCDWNVNACGLRIAQKIGPLMGKVRTELGEQERIVRFAGLIWVQGEADSSGLAGATGYAERFRELISLFRQVTAHPELPAVIARVAPTGDSYQYVTTLHEQMRELAATDPFISTVTCVDIPLKDDEVHFTAEGQISLGGRLADAFLAMRPFENLPDAISACDGDINWDGVVESSDLGLLMSQWGSSGGEVVNADINFDNIVDAADLAVMLVNWGACPTP